jgi:radial spoke head protein 4A
MTQSAKKVEAAAEEEEPANDATPVCFMPDLIQDNKQVYQWAGVNFGEHVCMLLQKSLQSLGKSSGATALRFWGKINGTEKDYYIAEGTAEAAATEEEPNPQQEPRGAEGVNKFAYWVCNCPSENRWTALPDLLPADVDIARQVKFHFSGDLERGIITNPFLHKREKFLLRAQIARISHSTSLIPSGLMKLDEEDKSNIVEVDPPEEGPAFTPKFKDMTKIGNWRHHSKSILNACRTKLLIEEEPPEGMEPEEFEKMVMARDPAEDRLKSISQDRAVKGGAPAWTLRTYGDCTEYHSIQGESSKVNFGTVVVRCNTWPGAFCFFTQQKQHMHVYLGDGLKFEAKTFYPVHTPKMQADPVEKPTYLEPNPTAAALKRIEEAKAKEAAGAEEAE